MTKKLKPVLKHKWDTIREIVSTDFKNSNHKTTKQMTIIILDVDDLKKLKKIGKLEYEKVQLVYSKKKVK